MAGTKQSGRHQKPGKVYQFDFYYRLEPDDPPQLAALLEAIVQAKGRKRRDILRAALLGGASQAQHTASRVENSESAELLDDLLSDF
jgi:hypothetical protein